jgi:hypothetical protein
MEHRWARRLVAALPVRLRCIQSPDSGCRCLARLESVSASGALIRTELGICPSRAIAVETLTTEPGQETRELPACIVRAMPGEIVVEWTDVAPALVSGLLTDVMLSSEGDECEAPKLGRVRFCALSGAMPV